MTTLLKIGSLAIPNRAALDLVFRGKDAANDPLFYAATAARLEQLGLPLRNPLASDFPIVGHALFYGVLAGMRTVAVAIEGILPGGGDDAAELARLGWTPEIALFSDHFDWAHKSLGPVLEALGLSAAEVVMVGDSGGDVRVALEVGCDFVWAGWNPRVAAARPDGSVLDRPDQLLDLYG